MTIDRLFMVIVLMVLVNMLLVFLFTFSSVIQVEYWDCHVRLVVVGVNAWCLCCNQLIPFVVSFVSAGTTSVGGNGGNAVRGT